MVSRAHYVTVTPMLVQAAFTAAPTEGIAPLTVAFANVSTGDYSVCLWDFGDSTTTTEMHPWHQYAHPGAYTVTLTVSGPGGMDTVTQADCITARHGTYLPLTLRGY
jgi:PKD repeat protein